MLALRVMLCPRTQSEENTRPKRLTVSITRGYEKGKCALGLVRGPIEFQAIFENATVELIDRSQCGTDC